LITKGTVEEQETGTAYFFWVDSSHIALIEPDRSTNGEEIALIEPSANGEENDQANEKGIEKTE
jgi:hypothetical protein